MSMDAGEQKKIALNFRRMSAQQVNDIAGGTLKDLIEELKAADEARDKAVAAMKAADEARLQALEKAIAALQPLSAALAASTAQSRKAIAEMKERAEKFTQAAEAAKNAPRPFWKKAGHRAKAFIS